MGFSVMIERFWALQLYVKPLLIQGPMCFFIPCSLRIADAILNAHGVKISTLKTYVNAKCHDDHDHDNMLINSLDILELLSSCSLLMSNKCILT